MVVRPTIGWLKEPVNKPGFWLVVGFLVLITIFHYGDRLPLPAFMADLLSRIGLDRHAFERIAYLVPIIWSVFLFRLRGAVIVSLVALVCMLPRAIFISEYPVDAFFETFAVLIIGNVVIVSFDSLRKQRERLHAALTELEAAHQLLQRYVRAARSSEKRLSILNAISGVLTRSLAVDEVLEKSIHMVTELMEVEVALVYSVDGPTGELVLVGHDGVSDEFAHAVERVKLGEGYNGQVAQTGRPAVVPDASVDPILARPNAGAMKIRNELIVPLIAKGRVTGTLCVAMRRPREFTDDEIDLLVAVGNQIAVALENARLFTRERVAAGRAAISEMNTRELFEGAGDAMWVHDLEGNIILVNRQAERLTGYSRDELVGMNVTALLSDESPGAAGQVRRRLFENEPLEQPYEQRIIRKDGSEAVLKLTTSLVLENGSPKSFQSTARDVTEEKRRQQQLLDHVAGTAAAAEEAREHMARDLEAHVGQALQAISRRVADSVDSDTHLQPEHSAFLRVLHQQLNDVVERVQHFNQGLLGSTALQKHGLPAALKALVAETARLHAVKADLTVSGAERRLGPELELTVFHLAQEVLGHAVKRSNVSKLDVALEFAEGWTRVSLSDDGAGGDSKGTQPGTPSITPALAGLEERLRQVEGSLDISSGTDGGTTVVIQVPG